VPCRQISFDPTLPVSSNSWENLAMTLKFVCSRRGQSSSTGLRALLPAENSTAFCLEQGCGQTLRNCCCSKRLSTWCMHSQRTQEFVSTPSQAIAWKPCSAGSDEPGG